MSAIFHRKIQFRHLFRVIRSKYVTTHNQICGVAARNMIFRPSQYTRNLANIAHLYQGVGEEVKKIDSYSLHSLDESFAVIDEIARRNGRILRKHVDMVFDSFLKMGGCSSIQALYLIRTCGQLMHEEIPTKRTEFAQRIWDKIVEFEIPIDASHYNALLKVFLENGHTFSPVEFLNQMEQNDIKPNRVTYQRLIEKYCEDGDLNGSSIILEYMKEKGIPVNEAIFTSLIKGHAKSGDFKGAFDLLEVMKKSQLNPNSSTFTTLALGFVEKGDIETITTVFQEAEKAGVLFSNKDYLSIIYKLYLFGHNEFADRVFSYIEDPSNNKQECANIVLDLLNNGSEETAFNFLKKLMLHMDIDFPASLFVKQLIVLGKPVEKIIEYCAFFKNGGCLDNFYYAATRAALENKNVACAIELLKEIQKLGLSLPPHLFWPIFAIHIKNKDQEAIYDTLKLMADIGLPADFDTYGDYIYRGISTDDPKAVVDRIKETGQAEEFLLDPLFKHYCEKNDLKSALYLCSNYDVRLPLHSVLDTCAHALSTSKIDCKRFVQILQLYHNSDPKCREYTLDEFFSEILTELSYMQKMNTGILREVHHLGIQLLRKNANTICDNIGLRDSEAIQIIRSLQYGAPLPYMEHTNIHPRDMDLDTLEKHVSGLRSAGMSTRGALRQLLTLQCKNKDLDKIMSTMKELDEQGFIYSPAAYALLIDSFVSFNNLEEAERIVNKMQTEFPSIKLDNIKAINYAILLIRSGKHQEALDFIKDQLAEMNFQQRQVLMRGVKKLLNVASDTGNVKLTSSLFEFCFPKLNLPSPTFILEPLVQVHLNNNDVDAALEEYEHCLDQHKFAPCRHHLFRKLISMEAYDKLQRIVDITAAHKGRTSTLHELAYSFIDSGHVQQAHKVFQTLGERTEIGYLEELCSRFVKDKKVTEFENFIDVIKDFTHINMDKMYYNLLSLYAQENDYKKALNLWDTLQDADVQPSIATLRLLANLLVKNNQPVPFVVPSNTERSVDSVEENDNGSYAETFTSDMNVELVKHIESGNITEIIDILKRMKKGHVRSLTTEILIDMIDLLARNHSLKEISPIVQVMSLVLEKARTIFKPLLDKYSAAGNIEIIRHMREFLPDFTTKNVAFNFYFNKVHLEGGHHEKLLEELERNIGQTANVFSFGGFIKLLESAPQLEERIVQLVNDYATKENFDLPRRALWSYYFSNEQYDKAEEIFKEHSALFTQLDAMGTHILKTTKSKQNDRLGKAFLHFLKTYSMKKVLIERMYNCLLDVYVNQSNIEEAVKLIDDAKTSQVPISCFSRSLLIHLKRTLETTEQPVPFEIPLEEDDTSSSDSD